MKFTYQSKTSGVFKSIQLDLEGTIKKGGVSMTYKLNKPENQNAGTFDIKVKKIKISDFYTAFSGKKMDSNPLVNDDYINGATIVDPTIKGSRSESGETEIIMTGREKSLFYRGGSRGFLGLAIKEKYFFTWSEGTSNYLYKLFRIHREDKKLQGFVYALYGPL